MHAEASAWVARFATDEPLIGLEFGRSVAKFSSIRLCGRRLLLTVSSS